MHRVVFTVIFLAYSYIRIMFKHTLGLTQKFLFALCELHPCLYFDIYHEVKPKARPRALKQCIAHLFQAHGLNDL